MRTIAHLSDLHFGRVDHELAETLLGELEVRRPDLIVISGDVTQRARTEQFEAFSRFADRLPAPWLCVPGNHDLVPFWRPVSRLMTPFRHYRRWVSRDLSPAYVDDEIAVVGVNTARGFYWKEGRISKWQVREVERALADAPAGSFRIVFTHHPFVPPPDAPGKTVVRKARRVLQVLDQAGVDLMLAGHLHRGYRADIRHRHPKAARSIVIAQASTALSTRLREEPNAFNWITVDQAKLRIDVRAWRDGSFHQAESDLFIKRNGEWVLESQRVAPQGAAARIDREMVE